MIPSLSSWRSLCDSFSHCEYDTRDRGVGTDDPNLQSYFESKLRGSRYGSEYYLADIKDEFEKNTKRKFVGTEMVVNVKFANLTDNDIDTGVRMGRITVNG